MKKHSEEYSNVIGEKDLHREARRTLRFEADLFAKTLGPYGMNTILEDKTLHHAITKDGYTVYQNVAIYNRVGRAIARLIQKISGSVNEVVGDGTTSAVIVANELYPLRKLISKHNISPRILSEIMKLTCNYLVQKVRNEYAYSIPLPTGDGWSKEDPDYMYAYRMIRDVATISLNNDATRGTMVADIFMSLKDPKNGFINVEASKSNATFFDKDRGFEIFRGMIIPEMCTEPDSKTAIWANPKILLIKGQLMTNDIDAIGNVINLVIGKLNQPLVIIAGGYSQAITATIRESIVNYWQTNKKRMPLLCIEIDTESEIGKDELLDIEANIGAHTILVEPGRDFPTYDTIEEYIPMFGGCKKIQCRANNTRIIEGTIDTAKANFRIAQIEKDIELMKSEQHLDNRFNIYRLNKRKALLCNDMVTLYVGGDTLEEKESSADLFDDAVRGCRSASINGVVPGGNTVMAKAVHNILNTPLKYEEYISLILGNFNRSNGASKIKLQKIATDTLKEIEQAYVRSCARVLDNKFRNKLKSYFVAKKCVTSNMTYNLITDLKEKFYTIDRETGRKLVSSEAHVINSADTDIRILIAATSIIDLIITSNQFIRVPSVSEMQKNM